MQTKKAIQCSVIYAKPAPKQSNDLVANNRESREKIGDNGCRSK